MHPAVAGLALLIALFLGYRAFFGEARKKANSVKITHSRDALRLKEAAKILQAREAKKVVLLVPKTWTSASKVDGWFRDGHGGGIESVTVDPESLMNPPDPDFYETISPAGIQAMVEQYQPDWMVSLHALPHALLQTPAVRQSGLKIAVLGGSEVLLRKQVDARLLDFAIAEIPVAQRNSAKTRSAPGGGAFADAFILIEP